MGSPRDAPPVTLLYVDDDPTEVEALRTRLAHQVHNPLIGFAHPADLYRHLDRHGTRDAAVLVDLVMDPYNGFQVIQELRRRYPDLRQHSPVLAVTASRDPGIVETAREVGADAVLRKPTTMEDLVTAVGRPGWYGVTITRGGTV